MSRFAARDQLREQVSNISGVWPLLWANAPSIVTPDANTLFIEERMRDDDVETADGDGRITWQRVTRQMELCLIGPKTAGMKVFEDMTDAIEASVMNQAMALPTGEPVVVSSVVATGSDDPSDERVRVPVVITYQYTAR